MNTFLIAGVCTILATCSIGAVAQSSHLPDSLPELTKEGLIKDYRLAMDILIKQHPNPYKFVDSITLNKRIDSLLQKAAAQKDVFACMQFSPIQLIRDVHTNFNFSEQNTRDVVSNTNFFPFPVIIERGKILVNIKGSTIPFASELVSINGQPAKDIIASMSASTYSDGFINTGTDRAFGNFQISRSMRQHNAQQYELEYMEPQTKVVKKISMPALSASPGFHTTRQAVFPVNQLARTYWIFSSYDDARKTGTLTVNSFNLQEAYAYKEFSTFFKEVNKRGFQHVIIDIRNNGGGNPAISALLYSFLSTQSFPNIYNYRTRLIDISYPEYAVADGQRKLSDEDVRNNRNFLYQRFNKDSISGRYIGNERLKEGMLENYPPDKDAFKGKVWVLTGGGTVSAATYFATLVQKNKRGLIIGKETGSGEQSTTAAWFLNYLLPNTKSILTVPMAELFFFNSTTDNGRGILPDKEVPMDKYLSYIRQTTDPELAYAMELIGQEIR
ncbi:hypothetical protein HHL16_16180 [Pseudoflavitalea sp. G-6-1-2]|uniref:S41 family peptidase n=1 Tax=Pseudoflavitalea sp. G-6-1-2 TaxID=2728841 RepID=UPI00146E6B31|nr:S41 family peptidase [Pseudoflavitalea sp. G-6-1-2]NML22423.1 hypothetical protein [Pseudoflavitalea sp. G-6-1-2]